jgi:hypothetical protein
MNQVTFLSLNTFEMYRIKHRGEYKIGKSPTPESKISIVLFTRHAELENDCNLTQGCRRFPYLVLFPMFDFISHKHLIVFVYIPSSVFPQFIFPLLKLNIRLIHMQPYLVSISNVFHHKVQCI